MNKLSKVNTHLGVIYAEAHIITVLSQAPATLKQLVVMYGDGTETGGLSRA